MKIKKRDLTKRTKLISFRLLPDEIKKIREHGFGNMTVGIRRMLADIEKRTRT